MNKSLLICIAFHYVPERVKYLIQVINYIQAFYEVSFDIIVDTNIDKGHIAPGIKFVIHSGLEHPFHLTSCHRQHMKDNINKYDNFMYIEDDILVPYENYLNYIENFKLLYPEFVPSFIRIEEKNGEEYVSDVLERRELYYTIAMGFSEKQFAALIFPQDYHGFWVMPQKELKESINENFLKVSDGREFNAMWVGWGLGKTALVEIENGQVSKKCYSYHLPNNYALAEGIKNGKIKANEIFI